MNVKSENLELPQRRAIQVPDNPKTEWTTAPQRSGYSQLKGKSFPRPLKACAKF